MVALEVMSRARSTGINTLDIADRVSSYHMKGKNAGQNAFYIVQTLVELGLV